MWFEHQCNFIRYYLYQVTLMLQTTVECLVHYIEWYGFS